MFHFYSQFGFVIFQIVFQSFLRKSRSDAKSCTLWCTQVSFWYRRIDAILCCTHWSSLLFPAWHCVTVCVHFDSNCEDGSRKHLYNVVQISEKSQTKCNVVTLVETLYCHLVSAMTHPSVIPSKLQSIYLTIFSIPVHFFLPVKLSSKTSSLQNM